MNPQANEIKRIKEKFVADERYQRKADADWRSFKNGEYGKLSTEELMQIGKELDGERESEEWDEKQKFIRDRLVIDQHNIYFEVERSENYTKRGLKPKLQEVFQKLKPQIHGQTIAHALKMHLDGLNKPIGSVMEYGICGFDFEGFEYVQARIWIGYPYDDDSWLA